ncbi:collagenase-like isoform X2 [Photinus pyralis]|nr:collagenase-like isoform X2 [Photinus pyralis]
MLAKRGQFPWQVINRHMLPPYGEAFCGASLISDQWVLTAGHCAHGASSFDISLGTLIADYEEEEGKIEITTKKAIVHEAYDPLLLLNDIALIDLGRKVGFTDVIYPIRLATKYLNANVSVTLSGWGRTSDDTILTSLYLNYVSLTTIGNEKCKETFGNFIKNENVCCVGEHKKSGCKGDSGSPLMEQLADGSWIHVGVMSYVHKEGCTKGYPFALVRTASYREWIRNKSKI